MISFISEEKGFLLVNDSGVIIDYNDLSKKFLKNQHLLGQKISTIINSLSDNLIITKTLFNNANLLLYTLSEKKDLKNENSLDFQKLTEILDHCSDEIFIIDNKETVVYANKACEKYYGVSPLNIIGKTVHELLENDYYNPVIIPFVLQKKKRITIEQNTLLGKKVTTTATPILNNKNEIEYIVTNSRDIDEITKLKSDLKETEKLLKSYKEELQQLKNQEKEKFIFRSKKMTECVDLAKKVASSDATILILGESGTGKNVLATYIHNTSQRKNRPFITINCAALPKQLLESELFGYQRGAFTGANMKGKKGLLELADQGTLFLDEIAEIPLELQAKLLEAIQDKRFIPVGGTDYKTIDVRIITATNRNLEKMVENGEFREDLYYRLKVIEIEIPPLRERTSDIFPLANFFLNKFDKKYNTSHYFSEECINFLISNPWHGNIRELEHLVERLVLTVQETKILPQHLPKHYYDRNTSDLTESLPLISLDKIEEELIKKAYEKYGNSYKVAEVLNISQSTAHRKIRKYILDKKLL